ncbi:hypothetical protein KCU84_g19049, partial [Aureobasidium melanogenum]
MDAFNYSNRLVHQPYTESFGSPVLLCSSPDNQIIDHCYPEEFQPMFNTCQSPLFRPMQPIVPTQHEPLHGLQLWCCSLQPFSSPFHRTNNLEPTSLKSTFIQIRHKFFMDELPKKQPFPLVVS